VHGRDAVGEKVDDLGRGVGDACLHHGGGVGAVALHDAHEMLRQGRAGNGHDALDLCGVGHRHDACHDGNADACGPGAVDEIVEHVVIEEHLRGEELTAAVRLFFKVGKVGHGVLALGMCFGVAGTADAEVAAFLDLADEFGGVVVVGGGEVESFGDVASQGQHVGDALFLQRVGHAAHLFTGGGYAGHVGQRGHAVLVLDIRGDIGREVGSAAACAVGHAHEVGLECRYLFHSHADAFKVLACLGREDFEGKRRLGAFDNVDDLHGVSC